MVSLFACVSVPKAATRTRYLVGTVAEFGPVDSWPRVWPESEELCTPERPCWAPGCGPASRADCVAEADRLSLMTLSPAQNATSSKATPIIKMATTLLLLIIAIYSPKTASKLHSPGLSAWRPEKELSQSLPS